VNIQETFREDSVNIKGTLSEHSGNTQWTLSQHSVNSQWTFSANTSGWYQSCLLQLLKLWNQTTIQQTFSVWTFRRHSVNIQVELSRRPRAPIPTVRSN
jgi:hypothetical protein